MTASSVPQSATRLTYIFDAYCGWCYGFGPALAAFAREHAQDVFIEAISGGLFLDSMVQPMANLPHIAQANARISALTGVRFGAGYEARAAQPTFAMNSLDAARGFAALRAQAPGKDIEIIEEMQRAFFDDGHSLSDQNTYRVIATKLSLDPEAVLTRLRSADSTQEACEDIARARALGVNSFPTLLFHHVDGTVSLLGSPVSTAEQLTQALESYRSVG